MKMTIKVSDSLLDEARKLAAREGVTLSALVERGLSRVISEAGKPIAFKLRRVAFKGNGLQAKFRNASDEAIREAAYEGHGN